MPQNHEVQIDTASIPDFLRIEIGKAGLAFVTKHLAEQKEVQEDQIS